MKKITFALVALFLLGNDILAAGLRDVAGVSWSAAPASVVQTFKSRPGVKLVSETAERVTFKGGTISGMPVRTWQFDYANGKLGKVSVSFRVRQGSDAKGYLANQDFAKLRAELGRANGPSKSERGKNFEACTWRLSKPAGTMRLHHGWTLGVKDSSIMDLTFSPRG